MKQTKVRHIRFVIADEALRDRVREKWGDVAARHMHIRDGFSIVALHGEGLAGLISVCWNVLPAPLSATREGYIDIIEVAARYRRRGVARRLIGLSLKRAGTEGVTQVRAWSTNDRTAAIRMWKALGFCLCPVRHRMWGPEVTGYFVAKRLAGGMRRTRQQGRKRRRPSGRRRG